MKKSCLLGLFAIAFVAIPVLPNNGLAQGKSLKDQLVGTWTLASANQISKEDVKSDRWGPNPRGRAIFEANGRYTFMIFRTDIPKFASNNMNQVTAEEAKAAIQGMTANYGTWSIDEATKTLTTNIEGSSSPNLNGGTQKRIISSISADELKYTNPASQIGSVDDVVWKRAK